MLCMGLLAPLPVLADEVEDQVKTAYAAWNEAFNKGDAKALAALYSEDATFLPPTHEVIEGPAGVEKFFAGLFANGVSGHALELIEVHGEEDLVVAAAKWSAKGKDANLGGIATHVFEVQDDDSLKLSLHTFNVSVV
jgi:uncharacterized protein (TIGR02246 family)